MRLPFLSSLSEKLRGGDRPPFERFYLLAFILVLAFMAADLLVLYGRQYLLPSTPPPKKMASVSTIASKSYNFPEIVDKNIFNSDGKIPPALGEGEGGSSDGAPRKSSLPLDLIGTIVHADPNRSLATIVLRGQNKIEPYSVGQKVENMAEIKQVLRERVVFRNLNSKVLEYIEVPQDAKIVLSTEKPFSAAAPAAPKDEPTKFTFKRTEIDKELENLQSLLQQARAVPETGPDGQVRGYKLVEIQPGSIFERLGLRLGDTILSVNGESVTSPQKAMEQFQNLKSSNEIKLGIDRGGRETSLDYTVQ